MPFIQRIVQPTFLSRRRCNSGGAIPTQYAFTTSDSKAITCAVIKDTSTVSEFTQSKTTLHNGINSNSVVNNDHSFAIASTSSNVIESSLACINGIDSTINGTSNDVIINTRDEYADLDSKKSGYFTSNTTALASTRKHDIPDLSCSEFETVTNITLSNALRQMASLLIIANEIFLELNGELQNISNRSQNLKERINVLEKKVDEYDPKVVNVPVSDLATFALIKNHYKHNDIFEKELFTRETRSRSVQALYEAAGKIPINLVKYEGGATSDDDNNIDNMEFLCTPVLGQTTRKMKTKIDADIEIRLPAAIEDLRKWTSQEALGDVTVTPDCISRVGCLTTLNDATTIVSAGDITSYDTSQSALSSVNTDIVDSISAFVREQQHPRANSPTVGVNDNDYPLDHRLPSPEEQLKTIALKFPAQVIAVDVSGCQFDRLALARKSMVSTTTISSSTKCDQRGLSSISQPITRRQRSRRIRSKRRNTIAGTDQKEIEEAVNGEMPSNNKKKNLPENESTIMCKTERSRSSDILKNNNDLLNTLTPIEIGKPVTTLNRFSSLKEWGRNTLRLISNRNDDSNNNNNNNKQNKSSVTITPQENNTSSTGINDQCMMMSNEVHNKDKKKIISTEKEKRSLHERKPSYSSSEKGTPILSEPLQSSAAVKLRDTSSLKRQRGRNIIKKEDLHSSSGNWSASSESGRTSIASEITVQPKSSASSSSLNHCHHYHQSNGNFISGNNAIGSVPSRRRFLNTSASSSAASDGTATPDLQHCDPFYDDETSSAYSCDTEGYYTSFHVDSGLKTLKEEEPVTPLQSCSALSSSNSFEHSVNQTILTAENEYEIFGRGSTSTTTSSAGTVCTTLLATDNEAPASSASVTTLSSSTVNGIHHHQQNQQQQQQVPIVPERKSSLTKLNRSNSNCTSASSSGTLERSVSSSTVGSTLERSGTIKRNGVFVQQKEVSVLIHHHNQLDDSMSQKCSSFEQQVDSSSSNVSEQRHEDEHHPNQQKPLQTEFEYSECSDIEGVDRVERIRQKTEINTKRIPSMCIITPTTSDDDETAKDSLKSIDSNIIFNQPDEMTQTPVLANNSGGSSGGYTETHFDTVHDKVVTMQQPPSSSSSKLLTKEKTTQIININQDTGYATIQTLDVNNTSLITAVPDEGQIVNVGKCGLLKDVNFNIKHSKLKPFNNMLGKLKGVLPTLKRSPSEINEIPATNDAGDDYEVDEPIYDSAGEYVRISDVSNNNKPYKTVNWTKRNLDSVLSGNLDDETEYVSLNELPCSIQRNESNNVLPLHIPHSPVVSATTMKNVGDIVNVSRESEIISNNNNNNSEKINNTTQNATISIPYISSTSKTTTISTSLTSTPTIENTLEGEIAKKGARVQFDAHGKIIYNSDSLKRRKGAHTTFTPGPFVKEDSLTSTSSSLRTTATSVIGSPSSLAKVKKMIPQHRQHFSSSTKSSSPSSSSPLIFNKNSDFYKINNNLIVNDNLPITNSVNENKYFGEQRQFLIENEIESDKQQQQQQQQQHHHHHYQKEFEEDYQHSHPQRRNLDEMNTSSMLASLNTKFSITSTSSPPPSVAVTEQTASPPPSSSYQSPFQRSNRQYWTLQNTKRGQTQRHIISNSRLSYDDYVMNTSNPDILRTIDERESLKTTPQGFETYFSPIGKRSNSSYMKSSSNSSSPINFSSNFKTSTPLKDSSAERYAFASTDIGGMIQSSQKQCYSPIQTGITGDDTVDVSSKTCSDRLGTSKTSLMDFKRLLLATSTKNNTNKKLSAVEMLKLNKSPADGQKPASAGASLPQPIPQKPSTGSPLNILELSNSPKTYAKRRNFRLDNNLGGGSPSKSTFAKQRSGPGWRMNSTRTDVISTAIPEANNEEDSSGSDNTIGSRSKISTIMTEQKQQQQHQQQQQQQQQQQMPLQQQQNEFVPEKSIIDDKVDLKRNMFLQAEENNFMKGEILRKSFNKQQTAQGTIGATVSEILSQNNSQMIEQQPQLIKISNDEQEIKVNSEITTQKKFTSKDIPALETAL